MTWDDDDVSEMNEFLLTDSEVDRLLDGLEPSGDAALDAALAALRDLGHGPAPTPSAELEEFVGSGLAVAGSSAASSQPSSAPPLRPRQGGRPGGRHVAAGSATVAGILLVSATAAAAIGVVHHVATTPDRPSTGTSSRPTPADTHIPGPVSTAPVHRPVLVPPAAADADSQATPGGAGRTPGAPTDSREGSDTPGSASPSRHPKDQSDQGGGDQGDHGDQGDQAPGSVASKPPSAPSARATTPTPPPRPTTPAPDDGQGSPDPAGNRALR